MVEKLLGARLHEYKGDDQPTWTEWLPFIQCKSWRDSLYNLRNSLTIINVICFLILLPADQLNTTVHGVMKTTPYELVFGQPPRQNIFPGVVKSEIMEEDIEDILKEEEEEEEEKVKDEHLDSCDEENRDNSQDENQGGDEENREKSQETQNKSPDNENQDNGPDGENQDKSPDDENQGKSTDGENQGKSTDGENQGKSPDFLATTEKHRQLREAADKQYRLNAERMKLKYCKAKRKKVLTFSEGDFVSVRIPRIDRTSTDFHRLPCVVVERLGSEFHLCRLRYITKYTDWY